VRVLIASDSSRAAIAAVADAIAQLAPPEHVTLLTVLNDLPVEDYDEFDEPLPSPETQRRTWDNAIKEANYQLERAAATLAAGHVETRVEAGDVAPTICTVAREINADMIVIGAQMGGRVRRRFHTSVAERIVRDAPCAVLVAQGKRDDDGT
jgi:nucleotide-binding universal stress UspA family protein